MSQHNKSFNRRLTIESLEQRNLLCGNTVFDCDFGDAGPPVEPNTFELGTPTATDIDLDQVNRVANRGARLPDGSLPNDPHPIRDLEIESAIFDENFAAVPAAVADEQPAPANPVPVFVDDEPLDNLSGEIERAIQEVSEELSRLQNQQPVPSLADLPYISRLFRNTASRDMKETDALFMMVTPRIIIQQDSGDGSLPRRENSRPAESRQANDKLVDAPIEDANAEVDPFSLWQEMQKNADK